MRGRSDLEAAVASIGHRWWHSIDLGDGIVTPGTKPPETMRAEIDALGLPDDLTGQSVLDIGAWDGAFSFECERRGADRVVALDHFIWSVDFDAQQDYLRECAERGEHPKPWSEVAEVWKPDELPGRAGFDVAHAALDSKVEPVVADFSTMDLEPLGRFDVVLYLGVLYHVPDPFGSLQRVARVTRGRAYVETELLTIPGAEEYGACEFLATDELGRDPTNWWVPNRAALIGMLRAAGFARADMPPAPVAQQPPWPPLHRRLARAALRQKTGRSDPYPPVVPVRYRAVARAEMTGST